MKPGDHHVVNECYLPESGKWAMADLTHDLLLVQDRNGTPLNLVEFQQTVRKGEKLFAYQSRKDSAVLSQVSDTASFITQYFKGQYPMYYYYVVNYSREQKPVN